MKTTIPSPFDIIPPPPGPWEPTRYAWLLLIVVLLLCFWLIRRSGQRRTLLAPQIVRALETELSHAASQTPIPLERLSRLTKRLIGFYITQDLSGLTSPETRVVAQSLRKGDDQSRSAAEIVELLATIEDQEYAPRERSPEIALSDDIKHLLTAISAHTRRYKPS
jgi:hypothetical protein